MNAWPHGQGALVRLCDKVFRTHTLGRIAYLTGKAAACALLARNKVAHVDVEPDKVISRVRERVLEAVAASIPSAAGSYVGIRS